ncbi:MAG TPA: ATP-binding cassette domain-containing protein [Chitinispirillaceae bacterium]|nr:ATP-binding cassette domain-containing protein [Chitinispirillaceae bacterium]
MSIINIENLKKFFGKLPVLDGINLSVPQGTMLALLGPNGAGKTTTIKILSTLLKPDGGRAIVNGYDVTCDPRGVRRSIGLTGQYAAIDEFLTGKENLELFGMLYHMHKKDIKRRIPELLERFELTNAASRAVRTYSGGMRRKLDLAACIIASPPVVFLDEPTTGLDPRSRLATWEIIREMMRSQTTILLTTQQLEEADQLANNIAVINEGKIIAEGTSDDLKLRVGGRRLEILLKDNKNAVTASQILEINNIKFNIENRAVNIPTNGNISSLTNILALMEKNSIQIDTFSLRKPTLDDVFMYYTGHKTKDFKN